jgi:UrcA family protein
LRLPSFIAAHPVRQQFVLDELPRQEMSMSNKTGVWVSAAMLLAAAVSQSAARAAESKTTAIGGVEQTKVHFGDLNVDHPAGAAELYRRIRNAAESVCGDPQLPGSHMISLSWRSCVEQAVNRAVAAVDRPALTAYYRLHTKSSDQDASTALASLPQRQSGR